MLAITCLQHNPTNGVAIPNISHETTKVKTMVMVEILFPSSLTKVITQALSPCFASISLTCKAMALPKFFVISKKPMVTWQDSHLSFKKCTWKQMYSFLLHKGTKLPQEQLPLENNFLFKSSPWRRRGWSCYGKQFPKNNFPNVWKKKTSIARTFIPFWLIPINIKIIFLINKFCHLTTKTKWAESYKEFYG